MAKDWIKDAISSPGALTKKAKSAGASSPMAFARKEQDAPGKTGKQARLALTLQGFRKGKKGKAKKPAVQKASPHTQADALEGAF